MTSITTGVEIELDGETHTLKPSLKAARTVSRIGNGFQGVYAGLVNSNFDVFAAVIKAGITSKNISTDDLDEAIYQTGLTKLLEPVARFVRLLQNGGKEEADEGEQSEGNGPA